MRITTAAVLLTLVSFVPNSAEADGPRRFNGPNRNSQRAAYAAAVYPKYYGGFHARQLQNLGMPPGDIGIRGNNIFMNPW